MMPSFMTSSIEVDIVIWSENFKRINLRLLLDIELIQILVQAQ